ncbi:uncharacterized protein TRIADDRAFT_60631 [Trichoplax adhaerens]|uniref:Expressed protein n=1 Tax=Trichoplax adhaerens TaxID=10228 RepID=B3S8R0_TRIAD|nr:expressed protein [Trichoplax adhaerens]EDV20932.1 expressed protein [Trichoplax adhaerens]|eukprot:XP_002116576.1 expressed protein [Trichoplax adhaerens]
MNFKLVLIACLLFVATAYAAENDEIPEEIEKELADIEHPIEDREDEENEILAKEAELENLKEDEMKENAVKAAWWRRRRRRRRRIFLTRRSWWNQRVPGYYGR